MPLAARTLSGLLCLFGCVSAEPRALDDQLSLIQDHRSASLWPGPGDIIEKAEKAADSADEAAQKVDDAVKKSLDDAAKATVSAIESVVTTAHTGLENTIAQADILANNTKYAMNGFLGEVEHNMTLGNFNKAAVETISSFSVTLAPLVSALNISADAVRQVLKAAGFLHLSEEVSGDLAEAVRALNTSTRASIRVQHSLEAIAAEAELTGGSLSPSMEKEFKIIHEVLHNSSVEVNTTLVRKLTEGFDMFVSHLRATVEGVLPDGYMKEVATALDTLEPLVQTLAHKCNLPATELLSGFTEAITRVHEAVPTVHGGAAGPPHPPLLLSLAAGLCSAWLVL
mmetsp:Transcript_30875/g.86950  ORF Transcript_30875/g.86950 Transcript_30875/m.86950 type:complete len:341 (-) Transcript_30875:65-1087(-)